MRSVIPSNDDSLPRLNGGGDPTSPIGMAWLP